MSEWLVAFFVIAVIAWLEITFSNIADRKSKKKANYDRPNGQKL